MIKSLINGIFFGIGTLFIYGVFLFAWDSNSTGSLDADLNASNGDILTQAKWNSLVKSTRRELVPLSDTNPFNPNCDWKIQSSAWTAGSGEKGTAFATRLFENGTGVGILAAGSGGRWTLDKNSKNTATQYGVGTTATVYQIWKKCAF